MTGWRLGWIVVPERIVPQIEKLAQNLFICVVCRPACSVACFNLKQWRFMKPQSRV
jgi:aspartate/methionine/tyrosine aminotransferase